MLRVRVNLSGASMSNGVATHNFNMTAGAGTEAAAQDCSTAVWNMWELLISQMPITAAAQVDSVVEDVDPATGTVLNELTTTPGAALAGTTGGAYAAGVGGRIRWRTDNFVRGRRVVGTTFVVPLRSALYEDNGTLTSTAITQIANASATFLAASAISDTPPCIWSRPSAVGASDGEVGAITARVVPDQVSWLTSRRT